MRAYSLIELTNLTRAELFALHRQIAVPAETTPTPAELKTFPTN